TSHNYAVDITRQFEIEDAHSKSLHNLISPTVARTHHHTRACYSLAAKIDHGMRDRGIALDCVSTSPEKQIARSQIIEFKGIIFLAHHRLEFPGASQPDVLLAGIARHAIHAALPENKIDEARAIHSAVT